VRRVGLLGGSFDPPHCGHVLLGAYALSVAPIDELWVVPTFAHAFGKALTPFEERVRMCELAFAPLAAVRVLPLEQDLGVPSYTYRTLETLRTTHSDVLFTLVVGSDVERDLPRWRNAERVRELASVWVAKRAEGTDAEFLPAISSTEVRAMLRAGLDASRVVPSAVLEHCQEKGLYAP
jgi:nicotinate-nucleotide adenylyltransferase